MDRVETVINFEMPTQIDTYVHRIGRTARAGRGGRSCTLIGESRRHLMKELIKDAATKKKNRDNTKQNKGKFESGVIRSRSIPAAVIAHFVAKIQSLESHLEDIMQAEAVAKMDRIAEMEALKAMNIIQHSDEIQARPQREWFASNHEKNKRSKEALMAHKQRVEEAAGKGKHRMTRKKRRAREALEAFAEFNAEEGDEDDGNHGPAKAVNVKSAVRNAKRKEEEKGQEKYELSVNEFEEEKREAKLKKRKSTHSAGDGGLFDEEKVAFAPKKKDDGAPKVYQSAYNFKGYDPDRKIGKKKGNKKFKSKSKYRRR